MKCKRLIAAAIAVIMLIPSLAAALERPAANDIPVGTLIIGTHIVALRSLTTQIYQIALQSAAKENQQAVYYRSEFADGKWCDITDAENIFNLTVSSGKPVENSVIDSLVLTHYTMTNGKTYDLNTGAVVNPTDIYSPYDPASIPPLEPLKIFSDSLQSDSASNEDKAKRGLAGQVLYADYHTDETNLLDAQLAAMGRYISYLKDKNASAQSIDTATEVQQKLDNRRRSIVYSAASLKSELAINEAGKSYDKRAALTDLATVLSDVKANLDSEEQAFSAKTLSAGTTITEKYVYDRSLQLIAAVGDGDKIQADFAVADQQLDILVNVANINGKKVINREKELETAVYLSEQMENAYREQLAKGDIGALATAMASGNAADGRIEEEKLVSQLDSARSALQDMVTAVETRKPLEEKRGYMDGMLGRANGMKAAIPKDYSNAAAEANLTKYLEFLSQVDRSVIGQTEGKSEAEKLSDELAGTKARIKSALDKNDIAKADSLQKEADSLQNKLNSLDEKANGQLDELQKEKAGLEKKISDAKAAGDNGEAERLAAEKTALELKTNKIRAGLSSSGQAASTAMAGLKTAILDTMASPAGTAGDYTAIQSQIKQLSGYLATNPNEAMAMLQEIQRELSHMEAVNGTLPLGLREAGELVDNSVAEGEKITKGMTPGNLGVNALKNAILAAVSDITGEPVEPLTQAGGSTSQAGGSSSQAGGSSSQAGGSSSQAGGSSSQAGGSSSQAGGSSSQAGGSLSQAGGSSSQAGGSSSQAGGKKAPVTGKEAQKQTAPLVLVAAIEGIDSDTRKELLADFISSCGSESMFTVFRDGGVDYIPLTAIPPIMNLRLVSENSATQLLANGGKYYRFSEGSATVESSGGNITANRQTIKHGGKLWVTREFAEQALGLVYVALPGTENAVLVTAETYQKCNLAAKDLGGG